MNSFDHIFIGAGPINLLLACYHAKKGESVAVFDGKKSLCGAWGTVDFKAYGRIEIGCHIWDCDQEIYSLLKEILGLELSIMSPQPQAVFKSFSLPYERKNFVLAIQDKMRALTKLQVKRIIKKNTRYPFSLKSLQYLYPNKGAYEFSTVLIRKVNELGITIYNQTPISSIEIQRDGVTCNSNEEKFTCRDVHLASFSKVDVIDSRGKTPNQVPLKYLDFNFVHAHIVIKNVNEVNFSYLRLFGDEFIHRIGDVTRQTSMTGKCMLLVGFHKNNYSTKSEKKLVNYALDLLIKRKFIKSSNPVVEDYTFNTYTGSYLGRGSQIALQEIDGPIHYHHSMNLIFDLRPYKEELKSLINPT